MSGKAPSARYGSSQWFLESNEVGDHAGIDSWLASMAIPKTDPLEVVTEGKPVSRLHLLDESIRYESFDPSSSWDNPYTVLKVTFCGPGHGTFMSHSGEELLVPTEGRIRYRFAEYITERRIATSRDERNPVVRPNQAISINPSLPHATVALERGASAWMVIRAATETGHQLVEAIAGVEEESSHEGKGDNALPGRIEHPRAALTLEELADPSRFLLLASGLADEIRAHRLRAGYTYNDLSRLCNLSAITACKIEQASEGASLASAIRIARLLKVDVRRLLDRSESHIVYDLFEERRAKQVSVENTVAGINRLAFRSVSFRKGDEIPVVRSESNRAYSSLVLLTGRVLVELGAQAAPAKPHGGPKLLTPGGVAHWNGKYDCGINAIDNGTGFVITYK